MSAQGAARNTIVTATAACPAGKSLLGGGAEVASSDTANRDRVQLLTSRPLNLTTWTATGVVAANLGGTNTMTVTAYALCSL